MKQSDAIKRLIEFDRNGRHVYSGRDMAKLFPNETNRGREATLNRLITNDVLERPVRGVYVFKLAYKAGVDTLEWIARCMRRGDYNYISLESALSEYGLISQAPVDRLTIMTTGRKGTYKTPYGVIEFTHTNRSASDVIESCVRSRHPLWIATKTVALRDLKRVGRNVHLVEDEKL